ncbi:hypothetical protein GYMLUDRAFT_251346 [Collybiopsis luxurians FD-317 M1]|uniref:Uncharacterized protein n=1 Tax=Collybiopsis luxurians FD-317 M1 TaxID=944289 RepID=A0A0D0APS7_9AGAR|nr:hypothetical protein GYMLUDRAFT_251346 [Collybiopsis luxurians FD-317 M1]
MPFPFTFNISVPGLFNPFSAPPLYPDQQNGAGPSAPSLNAESSLDRTRNLDSDVLNITADSDRNRSYSSKRRPSPLGSRNDNPSTSRKRGWEPSFAEPSQSMPTLASSNGYLDTPAKYRELAEQKEGLSEYQEVVGPIIDRLMPHYTLEAIIMRDVSLPDGLRQVGLILKPARLHDVPCDKLFKALPLAILGSLTIHTTFLSYISTFDFEFFFDLFFFLFIFIPCTLMRLIISILFRHVAADEQQPPAKRRRGLAGSIVSTAVSAALIGTAVGLTVYRLWRDRGKDGEQPVITVGPEPTPSSPPPPPYSSSDPQVPTLNVVPPTPRSSRKPRQHHSHQTHSSARRRPRRVPHQTLHNIASFGPGPSNSSAIFPPTQPAFDFTSPHRTGAPSEDENGALDSTDTQMDWIGSKLSSLIEEGRKALGREVVVMSESKEDEVDDGSGEWVEEGEGEEDVNDFGARGGRSRGRSSVGPNSRSGSTSTRRKTGATTTTATTSSGSLGRRAGVGMTINAPSFNFSRTSSSSASTSPMESQFAVNAGLPSSLPSRLDGFGESENSWESPELRETMERARANARERRARIGAPSASSSTTSFTFS